MKIFQNVLEKLNNIRNIKCYVKKCVKPTHMYIYTELLNPLQTP